MAKLYFYLWLEWLRAGWHYLRHGGLLYAAHTLNILNRYARRHRRTDLAHRVYRYKNQVVELLHRLGHCVAVSRQEQIYYCYGWNFDGCDGRLCTKCGGTGIHHKHALYSFTFELPDPHHHSARFTRAVQYTLEGKVRYSWHQPASLVVWPVTLTSVDVGEYRAPDESRDVQFLSENDVRYGLFVLWWALFWHGLRPELSLLNVLVPAFRLWRHQDAWSLRAWLPLVAVDLGSHCFRVEFPFVRRWLPEREFGAWSPLWLYVDAQRSRWNGYRWEIRFTLFGSRVRDYVAEARLALSRAIAGLECQRRGHDWLEDPYLNRRVCRRCDMEVEIVEVDDLP